MRKISIWLSISMMLTGSAFAGKTDAEWNPPARFDHAYAGDLTVLRLHQPEVVKACRALFARYKIDAAAYPNQHGCAAITSKASCLIITVDETFMGAAPESVIRHETGHCNGWPANHPD